MVVKLMCNGGSLFFPPQKMRKTMETATQLRKATTDGVGNWNGPGRR